MFQGLDLGIPWIGPENHQQHPLRDARRFLGCFSFPEEAGVDLTNLMVSLFKQGLLKRLFFSHVWHSKPNYLKSLKHSVKTFVAFLENDQRQHFAFVGLTRALGNLARAYDCDYGCDTVLSVHVVYVFSCNLVFFYEFNRHSSMM